MLRVFRTRLLLVAIAPFVTMAVGAETRAQSQTDRAGVPAAQPVTLDSILAALDANIAAYSHSVPSFLCNEHVVSIVQPAYGMNGYRRTVTDSVFRVRRATAADKMVAADKTATPDSQNALQESRVVKAIDGKPIAKPAATSAPGAAADASEETAMLDGPMAVFGIFSAGLEMASTPAKICFRYHLHPQRKNHPGDKIVIDFESLPLKERAASCPLGEQTTGRATISPATMRVLRLEAKTREYEIRPGEKETWEWRIDYSPVLLSGMTFWMPSVIHSTAAPDVVAQPAGDVPSSGRRGGGATMGPQSQSPPFTYSLTANYSDYHLLNVSSRIIAVTGDDTTSAPENGDPAQP